jgi:hypothetical protein
MHFIRGNLISFLTYISVNPIFITQIASILEHQYHYAMHYR